MGKWWTARNKRANNDGLEVRLRVAIGSPAPYLSFFRRNLVEGAEISAVGILCRLESLELVNIDVEQSLHFPIAPMPIHSQTSFHPKVAFLLRLVGSIKVTLLLLVLGISAATGGLEPYWIAAFLILLTLNLGVSFLNKMPLQRRQWSRLLVHAALISLLVGLWISHQQAFKGELVVQEGEGSSILRMFQQDIVLKQKWVDPQSGQEHNHIVHEFRLPVSGPQVGLVVQEPSKTQPGIEIIDVLANGLMDSSIVPAPDGVGPGLEFEISGAEEAVQAWLLADHPDHRRLDLGPLDIQVLNFPLQEDFDFQAQASQVHRGILIKAIGSTELLAIPLPEALGKKIDAGNGVSVVVHQFVEHARVDTRRLVNIPDATANPAAELTIEKEGHSERHIIFSQFPEFSIHEFGDHGPLSGVIRLNAAHALDKPLLNLLCDPSGRLFTQINNAEGRQSANPLPQEDFTKIEGTPYTFTLTRFLANASFTTKVRRNLAENEQGKFLLKLRVSAGHSNQEFWLQLGDSILVPLLGPGVSLNYRRKQQQLPFKLGLESLDITYYPNSRTPQTVTSNVLMTSTNGSSGTQSFTVSQHQALDYMGYRLLQHDFEAGQEGSVSTTILAVSYDPGRALLYASFILLILGVGWYVLGDSPENRKPQSQSSGGESLDQIEVVLSPQDSPKESSSHRELVGSA